MATAATNATNANLTDAANGGVTGASGRTAPPDPSLVVTAIPCKAAS